MKGWHLQALAGLLLVLPAAARERYWEEQASGWFWYVVPPVAAEVKAVPALLVAPAPAPAPALDAVPELAAHRALQQRLEQTRIIAVMNPSPANLSRYLYTQREVMERASIFADVWQRVVWADPVLDYGVNQRPTNAVAVRAWDARQQGRRVDLVAQVAAEHGLFYVFGHDCLHCGQMAGVLARFAQRHGMEVQAVAVDGASHASFPDAWPDNGFAAASGAARLPALLLARLDEGREEVIPLAYGPLADVELEERVAVLAGMPVGTRY